MSLRGVDQLLRRLGLSAILMLAAPALTWAQPAGCASGACFGTPTALGGGCGVNCGSACQMFHCPPHYVHCLERPPCIRWKCGCPRPICNPCDLPHWGYYDVCWTPWPFPPNWTHCPTLPPAATVTLNPQVHPSVQQQQQPPPGTQQPRVPSGPVGPSSSVPPNGPTFTGGGVQEILPQPQRYDPARPPF